MAHEIPDTSLDELAGSIREWGRELGFQQVGIAGIDIAADEERLMRWLEQGRHGAMDYMQRHGRRRARPQELIPGTLRVIAARMDYLPPQARDADEVLGDAERAYVSRYALGRDYHKVLRGRLARLAEKIREHSATRSHRVFVDSGPILEKAFARDAGLGWIGKHTNLLNRNAGSWFFLGEILTDLPLPVDAPASNHCGTCRACIDVCPTGAIVAPYELDATRCISYLTIELRTAIPIEFRKAHGQPHLRLRRLPAGLPLEQVRARRRGERLHAAPRSGRRGAGGAVRMERRGISGAHRRERDPAHRVRVLAAKHRRRARQCADDAGSRCKRSRRGATTRRRSCASTCSGRWSSIGSVRLEPDPQPGHCALWSGFSPTRRSR